MNRLGNGLNEAGHREDELSVREAELSMRRRLGASEENVLAAQGNLARTYVMLGRLDEALHVKRDVYSGFLKLFGEEAFQTLVAASNYANSLLELKRFEEPKTLLNKTLPAARRVLGESHDVTLRMRWIYARVLYEDPGATLDDLREAVTTLEEVERTAQRVMGGAHPLVAEIEVVLRGARAALAARVGDDVSSVCEGVAAMTAKGA